MRTAWREVSRWEEMPQVCIPAAPCEASRGPLSRGVGVPVATVWDQGFWKRVATREGSFHFIHSITRISLID